MPISSSDVLQRDLVPKAIFLVVAAAWIFSICMAFLHLGGQSIIDVLPHLLRCGSLIALSLFATAIINGAPALNEESSRAIARDVILVIEFLLASAFLNSGMENLNRILNVTALVSLAEWIYFAAVIAISLLLLGAQKRTAHASQNT